MDPQPRPAPLSRRSLLKRGLFGTALLSLGGAGALAARGGLTLPLPPGGLQVLGPREYATLQAFARRAFPGRPGWPSADEARVALAADGVLAASDPSIAAEVKQLLGLFDNALAGLLFGGRLTPFSLLPPEAQDAVLREWQDSRLAIRRTGFWALRTLVHACYYGTPEAMAATGYVPMSAVHDPTAPVWRGEGPRPGTSAGAAGAAGGSTGTTAEGRTP
jgi:hypothetical protein